MQSVRGSKAFWNAALRLFSASKALCGKTDALIFLFIAFEYM